MKRAHPYIVSALIAFLSLATAGGLKIGTPKADQWSLFTVFILMAALMILRTKSPLTVKILAIFTCCNCFAAVIPFFPFVAMYSVVVCMYFFRYCQKLENWAPIFKMLSIIVLLNVILFVFQLRGTDSLFNWEGGKLLAAKAEDPFYFGSVGQHMQMASFSVIVACFMIMVNVWYFLFPLATGLLCMSSWNYFTVGVGMASYVMFKSKKAALAIMIISMGIFFISGIAKQKFTENVNPNNGRWLVWKKTIGLANQHPFIGHGIGTYKVIYNQVAPNPTGLPWLNAHNFYVQMIFEIGYPATFLFIIFWFNLLIRMFVIADAACFAGLMMLACDMLCHFPDRQIQCVFLMIAFLAYCHRRAYGLKPCTINDNQQSPI